jgi:hypothetical protein
MITAEFGISKKLYGGTRLSIHVAGGEKDQQLRQGHIELIPLEVIFS